MRTTNFTSVSGKEALEVVQENNGKNLGVQVDKDHSGTKVRLSNKERE